MSSALFLSASVPLPDRDRKYFETADVISIRDSVRALVTVAVPQSTIVFGGHPAITPMIRLILQNAGISPRDYVTLYLSRYFEGQFPPETSAFERIVFVEAVGSDRDASLKRMRQEMIRSRDFAAGVFIGGMEGVEEEFDMFRELHPNAPVHPIASTGAAARFLFEQHCRDREDLLIDLRYLSLFRRLLNLGPEVQAGE